MKLTLLEINAAAPRTWKRTIFHVALSLGVAYGVAYVTEKGKTAGRAADVSALKEATATLGAFDQSETAARARRTRQRERRGGNRPPPSSIPDAN